MIIVMRVWHARAQVLPVVIGVLGSVPKKLTMFLERMGIPTTTHEMQKSALLGSVGIIRKDKLLQQKRQTFATNYQIWMTENNNAISNITHEASSTKKPELLKISHNFMYMDRHTLESIYFTYLQSFQSTKLL